MFFKFCYIFNTFLRPTPFQPQQCTATSQWPTQSCMEKFLVRSCRLFLCLDPTKPLKLSTKAKSRWRCMCLQTAIRSVKAKFAKFNEVWALFISFLPNFWQFFNKNGCILFHFKPTVLFAIYYFCDVSLYPRVKLLCCVKITKKCLHFWVILSFNSKSLKKKFLAFR